MSKFFLTFLAIIMNIKLQREMVDFETMFFVQQLNWNQQFARSFFKCIFVTRKLICFLQNRKLLPQAEKKDFSGRRFNYIFQPKYRLSRFRSFPVTVEVSLVKADLRIGTWKKIANRLIQTNFSLGVLSTSFHQGQKR